MYANTPETCLQNLVLNIKNEPSALGPRTVTWTAIFSFLRIPNVRTVYRALPVKVGRMLEVWTEAWEEHLWRRTVDGCLTGKLLKHFRSTGEPIARFANRDVQDQLLDA